MNEIEQAMLAVALLALAIAFRFGPGHAEVMAKAVMAREKADAEMDAIDAHLHEIESRTKRLKQINNELDRLSRSKISYEARSKKAKELNAEFDRIQLELKTLHKKKL